MQYDLLCLGELLIDFVEQGESRDLTALYQANAGGAPANVACTAQQFGLNVAFIGAVGKDAFGKLLIDALESYQVETRGVQVLDGVMTTLAFVSLGDEGKREFTFARQGSADTRLEPDETQDELLESTRALHFGTLSFTDEPSRGATIRAVSKVREQGGIISFDPNVRLNLWEDINDLHEAYREGLAHSTILKISDEDFGSLEGGRDPSTFEETLKELFAGPLQLLLLTLGQDGAKAYWQSGDTIKEAKAPTDLTKRPIDTTGAGDIFTGAFLSQLLARVGTSNTPTQELARYLDHVDPQEMSDMIRFANEIASLSTQKLGGITSIPDQAEWEENYGFEERTQS